MVKEYQFPRQPEQPESDFPDIVHFEEIAKEFAMFGMTFSHLKEAFYGIHFAAQQSRKMLDAGPYEQLVKREAAHMQGSPDSSLAVELSKSFEQDWKDRPAYYEALLKEVIKRGRTRILGKKK